MFVIINYRQKNLGMQGRARMISAAMQRIWEVFIFLFFATFTKSAYTRSCGRPSTPLPDDSASYCLSWRLGVEANNVRAWRTVPTQCLRHIENYMTGGQYERDLNFIMENIESYVDTIQLSEDGLDAWILDVDDTCISNVLYYRGKRFGCDPFDPDGFRKWALRGGCPAIPAVQRLFNNLVGSGFKVFLVTGRDEETLGQATLDNLHNQGFIGYEKLIMRSAAYRGQSAVAYKSEIRKQLEGGTGSGGDIGAGGYRIWGNVGDQWSDLQGNCTGNRTFKLPNPMQTEFDRSVKTAQHSTAQCLSFSFSSILPSMDDGSMFQEHRRMTLTGVS